MGNQDYMGHVLNSYTLNWKRFAKGHL